MKKSLLSLLAVACLFTSCLTFSSSNYKANVDPVAEDYQYVMYVKMDLHDNPEEIAKVQKKFDTAFSSSRLKVIKDTESLSDAQKESLLGYEYQIDYNGTSTNVNFVLTDYNTGKIIASFVCHDFDNSDDSSYEKCIDWVCNSIKDSFTK